jgi:hypothetical protein
MGSSAVEGESSFTFQLASTHAGTIGAFIFFWQRFIQAGKVECGIWIVYCLNGLIYRFKVDPEGHSSWSSPCSITYDVQSNTEDFRHIR